MKRLYLITGANGHLGGTLLRQLKDKDCMVRGLLLPDERAEPYPNVEYIHGDVRDPDTLQPLFADTEDREVFVIHTAGIVDISGELSPEMYDVNVRGTQNIIALCKMHSVNRLVYVSSVHAIPNPDAPVPRKAFASVKRKEKKNPPILREIQHFSPDTVNGGYAKTKAEATQLVLDAAHHGLDAVIVHPSGILGPYDRAGNHLVQMVWDYLRGKLPACVRGGYDLVDVRDVAKGCLLAAEKGKAGECYILSNHYSTIREVLDTVRRVAGGRRLPEIPVWMAKAMAPFMQRYAKLRGKRPLYTAYSLYALESNDRFSHAKATRDLGYQPRQLHQTIIDTVRWLEPSIGQAKKIRAQ